MTLPADVSWSANPGASAWQLDLAASGASGVPLQSYRVEAPEQVFTDLDEACYSLTVRAVDSDGFKGFDAERPLCIVARLSPVSELTLASVDPEAGSHRLRWSPVDRANRYRVEIAADAAFASLLDTRETRATELAITRPPVESFHVRVIALDTAGNESPVVASRSYRPPEDKLWGLIVLSVIYLLALI
jgi:hypothetical protein